MSVKVGILLTASMTLLGAVTSYSLWLAYGGSVGVQVLVTLLIASVGEHYVSGKGYYHYTPKNGVFIGRVPLWIPFMWVFVVQLTYLIPLSLGVSVHGLCVVAGLLGLVLDMVMVEPILCRMRQLWSWTPVPGGYFSFVPAQLNRFIAPFGNYFVWFLFPFLMALVLQLCHILLS